jgi:hypothetical protein
MERLFSMRPVPRLYNASYITVEAGSNTSTVTLRVVRGDEKGSLESETVKYGREYQGAWTWERLRWQGPAAYTKDRRILSSERAPHIKQDRNCQTVINIWSWDPDGARHQDLLTDWLTDWLTVSRNMTLTLSGVSKWIQRHSKQLAVSDWQFPIEYQTLRTDQQWN